MGLFSATDLSNADDDPYGFPVGRHEGTISKSEPGTVEWTKDGQKFSAVTWNREVTRADGKKHQWTTFMTGQPEQVARTLGQIKREFKAMEIAPEQWESFSENPDRLIGRDVIIDVTKGKNDRKYTEIRGVARGTELPASLSGLGEFKPETSSNPVPTADPFGLSKV